MKFWLVVIIMAVSMSSLNAEKYNGRYCSGTGDVEYLKLIDASFGFFRPNPDTPNISMLYYPEWDCLIEGSSWPGWWIQNSYGPTYCALPFLHEPWLTFLQNSQDMWFAHQGDGKTPRAHDLVGPDGCLCDCATPETAHMRQGDCRWDMHDWGLEFTAAGVVMQAELMLVNRDLDAVRRYLPNLERACEFLETRRDPKNGLFLAGPAANLLAPSYAGVRLPDGTFGHAYLAGLSITYLAACDRMVELHKLAGNAEKTSLYESRRKTTRDSLKHFIAPEGYFVKSIDPDGTKHGVLGQEKFGYFDAVTNVDAIAFGAADKAQSEKIYAQVAALPGLRPHDFIITNYPSLDDTYENWGSTELGGLWECGRWVNGGAWSTVEARAILAYSRLGKYEDIRRSKRRSMNLAYNFQMDAPLKDFGASVWFDDKLTNFCYDALGIPFAIVRGLFDYTYKADSLTLRPQIPPSIVEYTQKELVRFGDKRIMISVKNGGPKITGVQVNNRNWDVTSAEHVVLPFDKLPKHAWVVIEMTGGWPAAQTERAVVQPGEDHDLPPQPGQHLVMPIELSEAVHGKYEKVAAVSKESCKETDIAFERAYLDEVWRAFTALRDRADRDAAGQYAGLSPEKRVAIVKMYEDAALNLYTGFEGLMGRYASGDDRERHISQIWAQISGQ